ncbi:type II toxin-antitoxin system HigB family toxin [Nostoc sp. FACHB-87]|uniref:type II toxin-antitoxin system HigB family toxin n=1 Tax=Nostocaceae TaxID=1162 RepID=UPI0016833A88|nr:MULTISPECIES: type II toxin-antitoxin system HigB family toxin [Nostocaceae]MBD2453450.1 type II toxin-antitoxin system HigB family toxin [Nostoc sp. FACHB-87]MBD2475575.1 type II toxin-antitoxin system HigB family toxin [Anabaena sp. FACHB-83]
MHVISRKKLREFCQIHADSREALDDWFQAASKANWANLIEVQTVYPKAEAVSNFTVFNIKGNKYRLITSINYEKQVIYIKYVLTHANYDKDDWKHDPYY